MILDGQIFLRVRMAFRFSIFPTSTSAPGAFPVKLVSTRLWSRRVSLMSVSNSLLPLAVSGKEERKILLLLYLAVRDKNQIPFSVNLRWSTRDVSEEHPRTPKYSESCDAIVAWSAAKQLWHENYGLSSISETGIYRPLVIFITTDWFGLKKTIIFRVSYCKVLSRAGEKSFRLACT